jgi:DNA-binding transcriptional LysR family regulator
MPKDRREERRTEAHRTEPTLDLEVVQLRVLSALLRSASTVRAARELGVTQSAVSHSLKRLRDALGDPLFVRVGRVLQATERAKAFRGPVDEALAAIARISSATGAFDPARARGNFRIIAGDYAERVVLPRLLPILAAEAPELDLTVIALGDRLEDALQNGEADLALGGFFRERSGLVLRPLFRDPFAVVVAKEGGPRRMTLQHYLKARHVIASPRGLPGGIVDDKLAELGLSRRVVLRTPTFQTALAMAAEGSVVATAPRRLAEAYAQHASIRVLTPPLELPPLRFGLLYPESRRDDALHRWFREQLLSAFAREAS